MSQLEVDKIVPQSGTTLTIGDSGDTINFADGQNINIDSNTLYIDSTNNRVGIGTSSPTNELHIETSSSVSQRIKTTSSSSSASLLLDGGASNDSTYRWLGGGTQYYQMFRDGSQGQDLRLISSADTAGATDILRYSINGDLRFGTNGSERVRIDSSGRLFVNATSSILDGSEKFGVNGGHSSFQFSNTPLLVNKTGTDGSIISVRKDGTVVGSLGSLTSALVLESNSNTGFIKAGGSIQYNWSIYDFSAQSDNGRDLGKTSKRWKDLYLSGGVYVGGTGTANKLDDYEEGTWTPVCVGSTTAGTVTMNSSYTRGTYTKIGNTVYIHCVVVWSSLTGTGNLEITGIPFTSKNIASANNSNSSFVNFNSLTVPADRIPFARVPPNSDKITTATISTGGGGTSALAVDADGELYFNITYTTDA